jgi:hypothetical protein
MPSIEILAVAQGHPLKVDDLPFAVIADSMRKSHRRPSRFQSDFDELDGILYHLGNANLKEDHAGRVFFAYKLLSPESKKVEATFLEFAGEVRRDVEAFMSRLIENSPTHRLVFTSDWQFGPDWTRHEPEVALHEFWRLHDTRQVHFNALYPIGGSPP